MKHIKKHGGIHTMRKGGMYDAIMKFMGGGNMEYMREGGTDFGNLSVKAGIDKNPEVTYADKIAGAKMNEKGKGGRVYRMGGMNKFTHGGAHNDDSAQEASADPLKSPSVQAAIEKLLSPYRDQIDYLRQQVSKYGSNDPAVSGLRSQTQSAFSGLAGAAGGDVDILRELISMKPTNREEANQKAQAVKFAKAVSDEYARETGTPVKNPLYNFFGLDGGPTYGKGGRMYRMGGVNEMERGGGVQVILKAMEKGGMLDKMTHGGVHKYQNGGVNNQSSSSDIQVMAKDSYRTADEPIAGRDYIYLVDGEPTDFDDTDIANLLRSEGVSGKNLNIRMNEIFTNFPLRSGSAEEERAFRKRQMDKVLRDIERMAGEGSRSQMETGREYMSKEDLGNIARDVARGGRAGGIEYSGRYSPIGQKGTPKNVNTDEFLRALARNFRRS